MLFCASIYSTVHQSTVPAQSKIDRPPTHIVLKHTQETVIKPFPQVTQIRLVKAVNWRKDTLLVDVQQAPTSTHGLSDICLPRLQVQMRQSSSCCLTQIVMFLIVDLRLFTWLVFPNAISFSDFAL